MKEQYYVKTKKQWLGMIDKQLKASKGDIIERYGTENGNKMIDEIRTKFELLLPEIPRLDPDTSSLWTRQLVLTTIFLSVYKVMGENYGKDKEEAWEVCMMMIGGYLKSMPNFINKLVLRNAFSKKTKNSYKHDDVQLHKRKQPEGDVFNYIDGEGKDFDHCTEITECAKVKFLRKQNAQEFAPYVCLVDRLIAEAHGMGLVRTMTIADGYDVCDFKLTNNGVIKIDSPVWKDEWEKYL